eukprot:g1352.t2
MLSHGSARATLAPGHLAPQRSALRARKGSKPGIRDLRPEESKNDLTSLLGKLHEWRSALAAFEEMKSLGLQPGPFAASVLVRTLGRSSQWGRALQIFEESSGNADCALYSSAMKACDLDYQRVLSLFEGMRQSRVVPDLQSYGIAIGSCCSSQEWQEALDLLQRAHEDQLEPNAKTVSLVMKTMTGQDQWERALDLWHQFGEAELKVDTMAFTTAIHACAHAKLWRHALGLLDEMHQKDTARCDHMRPFLWFQSLAGALDLNPGTIPTSIAISACCQLKELEVAMELFHNVRASRESMDSIIYNAAIQSCGEGGLWREAINLFEELKEVSLEMRAKSYGALMTAMQKSSKWQKGLLVFTSMKEAKATSVIGYSSAISEMVDETILPDTISFNSAISATERSRKWKVAVGLLESMKELAVDPDVETYAAAILACVSGKQWARGLHLVELMPSHDLEPDAQTYGLLLQECEQRGAPSESALLTALAERRSGVPSVSRPSSSARKLFQEDAGVFRVWLQESALWQLVTFFANKLCI